MNALDNRPTLAALLDGFASGVPALPVSGLSLDSRSLRQGDVFVALRGEHFDARDFLPSAVTAGACAALVEEAVLTSPARLPVMVVPELRQRLGEIASRYYRNPSQSMHVAAVTGTNGKTTVSQLFGQLIRRAGYNCGVIGTLGASLEGEPSASTHTTPDPIALQATLADWAGQAVPFVAMEASSHALDQGRINGVDLDTAVFTNLSRDHLDYHGTMQAYGEAKAKLFRVPSLRAAVLNADDPFSSTLVRELAPTVKCLRYGQNAPALEVSFSKVKLGSDGLRLTLDTPWGSIKLRSGLLGMFNAYNLVAAVTAAVQAGLPLETVADAAAALQSVPGRMEPLRSPGAPLVVVDYAHTPDALEQVASALRLQCSGKLIVVFGCGGDRDPGKRAMMAEAVSRHADAAVITSDNPRSEDPLAIIADIEAGMTGEYQCCEDRAEAISLAIRSATAKDCVLIAGKGHEDYQIVGSQRRPFSDSLQAWDALRGRAA